MSSQITNAYAQQYSSTIQLLLQQKESRLSGTVTPHTITGAKAATPVEQIGKVEATERTRRYPPLAPDDTPHTRPWFYPRDFDWNDLIDSIDKLRILADPQSAYVQNGVAAMNRAKDRVIIGTFFADRNTGETGSTSVTFASEGNSVAVGFGASGNVGLTVAKLREAKRILMAAEVDVESDPLTVAVKAKQHDNLLAEMQVISLDFNERPVLVDGMVTRFLGFNFKHTELIAANGSSQDRVPAYAKSGVHLGIWADVATDVSQRKDLAGHPWQVYVTGTFGGTRSEGPKVVEIVCA